MDHRKLAVTAAAWGVAAIAVGIAGAQGAQDIPSGTPAATINLETQAGVDAVQTRWRFSTTRIIEVDGKNPDGTPNKTYSYTPHSSQVAKKEFDDSAWEVLDPMSLKKPRSTGKLCFAWYRLNITIPPKVGDFDTTGSTVVFDTIVDDYGEVYVDGFLNHKLGQKGGSVVAGFNAPNRLVVGRNVKPGDKFTIAVFGINSPIGNTPDNWIFLRYAKLDFYK